MPRRRRQNQPTHWDAHFPVAAQRESFWIRAPAKVAFLGFLIAFPSPIPSPILVKQTFLKKPFLKKTFPRTGHFHSLFFAHFHRFLLKGGLWASSPGVGMFHSDFLPILHENSKRVTVASKLVSRNDSGDIRTLLLTDLSAYKVISDFYRSKLSGWASARTSILRPGKKD